MNRLKITRSPAWPSLFAIIGIYAAMIATIMISESFQSWAIRILALVPMTMAIDRLYVLQHEGAHFLIHPNRRINDLITNWFCSFLILGSVGQNRYFHSAHHRHLQNPELDPEIGFYAEQGYYYQKQSRPRWVKILFLDFCGYHYLRYFFSYYTYVIAETRRKKMPALQIDTLLAATLYALTVGLLVWHWPILLFYWLVPQPTLFFFMLKVVGYAEHTGQTGTIEEATYSHPISKLAQALFYPFNSHLHLEHHLQPHLPWFKLKPTPSNAHPIGTFIFGDQSLFHRLVINHRKIS
jgi:fatty acid desaturase